MTAPCSDRIPTPALVLGAGGLIPFVSGAALQVMTHDPRVMPLLASYGAVILSFVGALHWGYAVRDTPSGAGAWLRFGWSVVPALMAWVCLMLPAAVGVLMLAGALSTSLAVDEVFVRHMKMPVWLMPLRRALTAVGAGSLVIAALV
ncbi:MAG: DUF3429 domain-containing protein [Gammaproteobacteria bacterium]